jgi:hypothetical protein
MTDSSPIGSLEEQAAQFADELTRTLVGLLPGAPPAEADVSPESGRVVVGPREDVPLFIGGTRFARLHVRLRCRLDSRGAWLAVESSGFTLIAAMDRTPVIRFEYLRSPSSIPGAHIQVHAHRGALSHLLSQAGHNTPHDISALHIPVGGARFRPCLEDVVQFLVAECRFDGLDGWQEAVKLGRTRWRRAQAAAVARDFPEEAARTLRALGYGVEPPATIVESPAKALHGW